MAIISQFRTLLFLLFMIAFSLFSTIKPVNAQNHFLFLGKSISSIWRHVRGPADHIAPGTAAGAIRTYQNHQRDTEKKYIGAWIENFQQQLDEQNIKINQDACMITYNNANHTSNINGKLSFLVEAKNPDPISIKATYTINGVSNWRIENNAVISTIIALDISEGEIQAAVPNNMPLKDISEKDMSGAKKEWSQNLLAAIRSGYYIGLKSVQNIKDLTEQNYTYELKDGDGRSSVFTASKIISSDSQSCGIK